MEKTQNNKTMQQQLAHVISEISNPLFIALPTFLVIALIAAVLGFGGIAGVATSIAHVTFVIFIVLFLLSFVLGRRSAR